MPVSDKTEEINNPAWGVFEEILIQLMTLHFVVHYPSEPGIASLTVEECISPGHILKVHMSIEKAISHMPDQLQKNFKAKSEQYIKNALLPVLTNARADVYKKS